MFKKVLVANRGEIAVRIIRALREMGITSVAIFSQADRDALHTHLADEAICVGPAKGTDSYANPVAVLSAAIVVGADAIHPGYGFLSERADFVQMCEDVGISFIGPTSQVIASMGNKQEARHTMKVHHIPIIPGSDGLVHTIEEAEKVADVIGYPLMIKAADGGGGKGMRRVNDSHQLASLFQQAQMETQSIYGNQNLYMERIITPARHIEVQILADHHGQVIHLGERDCSLQRKHQKVIEVAPAMALDEDIRQALCGTAVAAAKAIGYRNAGTIEFLVDANQDYYFMEMNTRLQVEHPVTEAVTGIDIVKEQIRIAANEHLMLKQSDVEFHGVAIECRLNAEDPRHDFRAASGHIERLILPAGGLGLRIESALYSQYTIPPFYDSMVAKIIVHQPSLVEALQVMQRALYEVEVEGIETNVALLERLIQDPHMLGLNFHTQWIENELMPQWIEEESMLDEIVSEE